jgi:hypothetical protein
MRKILKEKKAEGQKARNDKIRGYFQKYYGKDILDDPPERGRRGG